MRIRYLKPGFFKNEELSELSAMHRLLFAGLWLLADRTGRLEDRPRRIKGELFPYEIAEVDTMLADLVERGFLFRYIVKDIPIIQIVNFTKHQRPHKSEPVSQLPECVECSSDNEHSTSSPARFVRGMGNGERRTGTGRKDSSELNSEPSPAVLTFPVVGTRKPEWVLTEAQVRSWAELFPTVDVIGEARKALAWIQANQSKRKTPSGMPRFLVAWLTRATNGRHGGLTRDGPLSAAGQSTRAAAERAKASMRGQL